MKANYHQWLLSGLATAITGIILTQSYSVTANAKQTGFVATAEQKMTARQVAMLLGGAHYLEEPLSPSMGKKILRNYIDTLDPNHTLFLTSDVNEFMNKYGDVYADRLKRGDMSVGAEIFERYRLRSNQYFNFAKTLLQDEHLNLNTNNTIILDRENLSHFNSTATQQDYWKNQTLFALIGLTLSQENEKQKDQVFLNNPELARGQDLVKNEARTPNQIMINRINRQQAQLARLKDDEIMELILNSAMQTYDPHSNYFAPVQATEMQAQNNLQLEGIGVSIRPDRKNPDYTKIVNLVDGGPAAKTGQVRPNDLIIGIAQDGGEMVDVVGYSTREIVALIRGKRGTNVIVRVRQPNESDSAARNVLITRDVIQQEESGVQHRVIEVPYQGTTKRVGVIEIPSFYLNFAARRRGAAEYRSVSTDTENAIKALNRQNVDGIVVDLRGNPGGSLDEVVKMVGMFIKQGPVVQIRDNQGNVQVYTDPDGGQQLYKGDMVVITDMASASASEIFAAAIQDYGRGLVVGSTTTGKGSAQVQRDDLALGSAALTQRKFYRVTGGSTQNKGVVPDIELVNIYEGAKFTERDYKNPLPWDTIKTAPYRPEGKYAQALIDRLSADSKTRQTKHPEFIYLTALNAIKDMDDDTKPQAVNLDARRALYKQIEARTLVAENARRQAAGEAPFATYSTYQAWLDALYEERGAMKDHERPKLPEDEVFITEAATLMFDAKRN